MASASETEQAMDHRSVAFKDVTIRACGAALGVSVKTKTGKTKTTAG
jgi:hypothetical protein